MRQPATVLVVVAAMASSGYAQAIDSTVRVTVGGFIDTYYAWDFGRPQNFDRSFASGLPFTTQPARHNEFNINLAFLEARLNGPRVRGRLALQAGTSVQSNSAGEPGIGLVSGPSVSRILQEAVVGTQLKDDLWVDAGVYYSHLGMESWASRDNLTYTRSLVADYSPFYQSGVRLTWNRGAITAQFNVVNGWQNISENNSGKGAGVRVDYQRASALISYYNLVSSESGSLLRVLNGVGARLSTGPVTWLAQADLGSQQGVAGSSASTWYGAALTTRARLSNTVAVAGRAERFDDVRSAIVATGVPLAAFRGNGGSLGIDVAPAPHALWRTEVRGWFNSAPIFPDGAGPATEGSLLIVSSLSLSF